MKQSTEPGASMTALELRGAISLAAIYSLRMLGLFMLLPVLALYGEELEGATPTLVGLAIGIYGVTQALLQIPYGLLSDRFGRKPLIVIGLLVFAAGSVVAAMADTMTGVIAGRAIQGAGAIAAVVMALAADLTREEHRTKVMAVIGMSIGLSFAAALVLGPVLSGLVGVQGIFWLIAVFAFGGIGVLLLLVPDPVVSSVHRDAEPVPAQFLSVLKDVQLLRLDFGILILHMILTASFVVLPIILRDVVGLEVEKHWQVYLPALVLSVLAMVPFMIIAERWHKIKPVFIGAIILVSIAQLGFSELHDSLFGVASMLWLFFTGFNLLEATLPSLVSRMAPPDAKGTAMGFYSTAQFTGVFLGGLLGGWLYGRAGFGAVFLLSGAAGFVWCLVAIGMRSPLYVSSYSLALGRILREEQIGPLEQQLLQVRGVAEAVVVGVDQVAYLKIDSKTIDKKALERIVQSYARSPNS